MGPAKMSKKVTLWFTEDKMKELQEEAKFYSLPLSNLCKLKIFGEITKKNE